MTTVHPNFCVESITFNANTVVNLGKLQLIFGFPNWVIIANNYIIQVYQLTMHVVPVICLISIDRDNSYGIHL